LGLLLERALLLLGLPHGLLGELLEVLLLLLGELCQVGPLGVEQLYVRVHEFLGHLLGDLLLPLDLLGQALHGVDPSLGSPLQVPLKVSHAFLRHRYVLSPLLALPSEVCPPIPRQAVGKLEGISE